MALIGIFSYLFGILWLYEAKCALFVASNNSVDVFVNGSKLVSYVRFQIYSPLKKQT